MVSIVAGLGPAGTGRAPSPHRRLAPHFQTFGEDCEINKADLEITVKLKHPGRQYSVYENHGGEKKPQ